LPFGGRATVTSANRPRGAAIELHTRDAKDEVALAQLGAAVILLWQQCSKAHAGEPVVCGRGHTSNCVVGSDGGGTPLGVVTKHGVEGHNHLAHHSNDDDLGLFASGGEALGEGFKSGTVSACAQGCHVENVTRRHTTAIDTAVSFELSAIEVVWRETDEGSDLLAIDLASCSSAASRAIPAAGQAEHTTAS
jgi:hypothetical protein